MLEHAGKQLSALSALLLALSVVYDYFYLEALGLSFATVPTTIADHLRSAIIWLPSFLATTLIGFLLGLTKPRSVTSTTGQVSRRWIFDDFIVWNLAAVGILLAWTQRPMGFGIILGMVGGVFIFHFRPGVAHIEALLGEGATRTILVIPVALALISSAGYYGGDGALDRTSPLWKITLRSESGIQTVLLTGYRRFGSAVVIVDTNHLVRIVPPESIIEFTPQAARPKLFRCYLLDALCPAGG